MYNIVDFKELTRIRDIGSGSYGDVFSAKWPNKYGDETIAVKKLRHSSDSDQELKREIDTLSRLKHPNIITLYGVSIYDNRHYHLILEYADCGSLYDFLYKTEHLISYTGKLNWILQCATGIAYLHAKNIMHRDLKSHNILLFDKFKTLKLCDFGTVKEIMTENTANTGTSNYMAPEVAKSPKYDAKCDVYSFGIIFWEVMSRKKPFYHLGSIPSVILQKNVCDGARPNLNDIRGYENSNHIKPIIEKCWHSDPKERPTMKGLAFTLSIDPSLLSDRPEFLALVKKLPEIGDDDFRFQ